MSAMLLLSGADVERLLTPEACINSGDRIFCSSRIDLGTQPPSLTLFGANMVSTVQQP
jgi:hypothetical protein